MKNKAIRFLVFLLFAVGTIYLYQNQYQHKNQHWTYEGETSPEHWAEIEKNSNCNGERQSPINIIDIKTKKEESNNNDIQILYSPTTFIHSVVNNGHSI